MKIISITSGKGGVGKSQIMANLGVILAKNGYKTALLEVSDLPNLDIILNCKSNFNLNDAFSKKCDLDDIFMQISPNFFYIPTLGDKDIWHFSDETFCKNFITTIKENMNFDFLLIETDNSLSKTTQNFIKFSDEVVVIATPEPASISGAYAMLKFALNFKNDISFITNFTKNLDEANLIFENLRKVIKNNIKLTFSLNLLGFLPKSNMLINCIKKRVLIMNEYPSGEFGYKLGVIVSEFLTKQNLTPLGIKPQSKITKFFIKLFDLV